MVSRASERRLSASLIAFCLLGLVFAGSLEAMQPLCAGQRATVVSDDRTIRGSRGPDVIVGGSGANTIFGGGGNDVVCGGPGRDRIFGGRGNDAIEGEDDGDLLRGDRGSDELDGGGGRDRVRGGSGNDLLRGGPADRDDLEGGPGDDRLDGGGGDFDLLFGGIGRDRVDGGPGHHDIASYRDAGGPISVDLGSGTVSGAEEELLSGIEDVMGGTGDDLLATSEAGPNRLDGGPGDDRLLGSTEGDQAYGGPGSDQCFGPFEVIESCGAEGLSGTRVELYRSLGGAANLAIAGDAGDDSLTISFRDGRYLVSDGSGAPVRPGGSRFAGGCDSVGTAVACRGGVDSILVSLGAGDDELLVDDSLSGRVPVTVDGGPGSDRLRGGSGADTLYGGDDSDPDRLVGSGGDDALFGVNILHPRHASGAATLVGGGGDDLMIGGQPCDGDSFEGGPGDNDSASFARVRNSGTFVVAAIGGAVSDPDVGGCAPGQISADTEKIEGSTGPDVLTGSAGSDVLLGRGGNDQLDGLGGGDRCIGGRGADDVRRCEYAN
ncbi:MAG TPA: calcium-binding protein [Solirubrobacterales bacterium]|nr:calcium-binding protein [Solirubrobacterales bacterium]